MVLESTVYPGATEEVVGPTLAALSGLAAGRDFFLGYSPERINPGDREHTLGRITKVVAGQTPEVAERLAPDLPPGHRRPGLPRARSAHRRGGEGDRECAARHQHRLRQRGRDDLPAPRAVGPRRARGRAHQVELPGLPAGPGGRPLHRGRPLLPRPQGAGGRSSPADHPRRARGQRRDAGLRRRGARRAPAARRAHPGARPDLQGERARSAQLQGRRADPAAARRAASRSTSTTRSPTRRRRARSTACGCWTRCRRMAPTMRCSARCRTAPMPGSTARRSPACCARMACSPTSRGCGATSTCRRRCVAGRSSSS